MEIEFETEAMASFTVFKPEKEDVEKGSVALVIKADGGVVETQLTRMEVAELRDALRHVRNAGDR